MENRILKNKSTNEKIYIFLILIGMGSIIYFIATSLRNKELKNIKLIKTDYTLTRGIVIEKHTQKGNSIHVRYKVNGKVYEGIDGFNEKHQFNEGDSLNLKYSNSEPNLMITEFNDEY